MPLVRKHENESNRTGTLRYWGFSSRFKFIVNAYEVGFPTERLQGVGRMKKGDWIFALFMMVMGLCCLTVSATSFLERPSDAYARTLLTLCLWVGVPLLLLWFIYLYLSRHRHR